MKKLLFAVLMVPSLGFGEAWLTAGHLKDSEYGEGGTVNLSVEQSLSGPLSLEPSLSFASAEGYRDKSGTMDLSYYISPALKMTMGFTYDKYELYGVEPVETGEIHVKAGVKLW